MRIKRTYERWDQLAVERLTCSWLVLYFPRSNCDTLRVKWCSQEYTVLIAGKLAFTVGG
jgi:hypothetical protein